MKLGALAWARDNAQACHLISRGGGAFYIAPPRLKCGYAEVAGAGQVAVGIYLGAFRGETAANVGGGWLVVLRSRKSTRVPSLAGLACDDEVAPLVKS